MRETRTAEIALRGDGVVVARIRPSARQDLADAQENLAGSIAETGGRRRPMLVDISRCEPAEPEVRHYYSGELLVGAFSALGLLVAATPFGRMMGNVYLKVTRPGIPTRLFTDEASAIEWLRAHLNE